MATGGKYTAGATVRMAVNVQVDDVDTDPTTLTLYVTDPSGTATSYTYAGEGITKDSVGDYHKDLTVTTVGKWWYGFKGTGDAAFYEETWFRVEDARSS